ncbi:hypothetical protein Rrhod_2929 [Rhodococcus rhodnii LMG 5362]|uniref:Uncharacterized protein n=1 Tax=Rhodococcus rhodnii LMG 5362 TaxID=1273125 RepID=R7WNS7_9NOCA|nr:hypothetical protein Rrhod_2929 [Rhodococcus rhodnii LMG 5362]
MRFTSLWGDYVGRVSAYACRHVDHHTAQEVVSEKVARIEHVATAAPRADVAVTTR